MSIIFSIYFGRRRNIPFTTGHWWVIRIAYHTTPSVMLALVMCVAEREIQLFFICNLSNKHGKVIEYIWQYYNANFTQTVQANWWKTIASNFVNWGKNCYDNHIRQAFPAVVCMQVIFILVIGGLTIPSIKAFFCPSCLHCGWLQFGFCTPVLLKCSHHLSPNHWF